MPPPPDLGAVTGPGSGTAHATKRRTGNGEQRRRRRPHHQGGGEVGREQSGFAEHGAQDRVRRPCRRRSRPPPPRGAATTSCAPGPGWPGPCRNPRRQPTRADSPKVVGRKRSATRPGGEAEDRTPVRSGRVAGHDGQEQHRLGMGAADPHRVEQGVLDGEDDGDHERGTGHVRGGQGGPHPHGRTGPAHGAGCHRSTSTYCSSARSATGLAVTVSWVADADEVNDGMLATGMAGELRLLQAAGGEHLSLVQLRAGGDEVHGEVPARPDPWASARSPCGP